MERCYVDVDTAILRLERLPYLSLILDSNWLQEECKKPVESWSQITGWLCSWQEGRPRDEAFVSWIRDLDAAIGTLKNGVSQNSWRTIRKKLRSHSDRSETLGTLSEIALCVFLTANNMPFNLEVSLHTENQTDVDVQVFPNLAHPVNIEVQWLSPSDKSERGSRVAASYGGVYKYRFDDYEGPRIKQKVYDKIKKFTVDDATLVALNYTLCPELIDVGSAAVSEAFTGLDLGGNVTSHANSDIDLSIRQMVDGVIWFTLMPGNGLFPVRRGTILNSSLTRPAGSQLLDFLRNW